MHLNGDDHGFLINITHNLSFEAIDYGGLLLGQTKRIDFLLVSLGELSRVNGKYTGDTI